MKKDKQKKHKLEVEVDLHKFENYHFVSALPNVFFPYEPYPQQIDIVASIQKAIENGENALIESPTGTGKTLCLLVGALSSMVDGNFRKKIFYLTRTHSQISQVVSEFKKTSYRCHMNIIASRQHLCINHNLQQLKGKVLEKACEQLCFQKLCTYKDIGSVKVPRQALDLQQFKQSCRRELACPYFYSKQLVQKCELTILPFNYLLEWNLFERSSIDIKDAVIIFDEAHNIDSLCEQGSDIRLNVDIIFQSLVQLRSLMKAQSKKFLHPQFREGEDYLETLQFKEQVELLLNRMKLGQETSILSKHQLLHLLEDYTTTSKQQGIDLGNYGLFISRGKKIVRMFIKKQIQCQSFQLFLIIFQKCYDIMNNSISFDKFAISISKTQLLFRCLDPSLCFGRIVECRPRSIILSSGTLGDLNIWENNLKIAFPHKINAKSFITDRQLYAQIKVKSQSGIPFNFSFQGKQNEKQFEQIGRQLKKLENIITGGIVVAFSTYQLLQKTLKYCSILQKKVYYETKGGSVDDIYSSYQKDVKQATAFLFIVIKGRFSQGINFAGQLCRCLIVIGIPFLPLKDPGVIEKMRYLENNHTRAQAQEWYTMQSFKGLNQTLGRAIRNKSDYAVILLFDQRYAKEEYVKNMSMWFSRCLRSIKNDFEDVRTFLSGASWKNVDVENEVKYSTKNKKEPTICERLQDFSTPNKSQKNKKKLKLVIQSQLKQENSKKECSKQSSKQEASRVKTQLKLSEIKVAADQQPCYKQMKKQLQDYFINFAPSTEKDCQTTTASKESLQQQLQQDVSIEDISSGKIIKIMRSYGKCTNILDF